MGEAGGGFAELAPAELGDEDVLGGVVARDLIFRMAVVRAEVKGVVALAIGDIAGGFIGEAGGGTAFKAYVFNDDVTRQQIGRAYGLRGEQDGAGEDEKSKLHFSSLGALCE